MKAVKLILWCGAGSVFLAAAIFTLHQFSPWPSALMFRLVMDGVGMGSSIAMRKHVPDDIRSRLDQRYELSFRESVLDLHFPARVEKSGERLTTIVWVHGGGFISGDKGQIANYLKVLAGHGYTVVGVNYTLAPREQYPNPVRQVDWALSYLSREASGLHINPLRFVLAGDSAGAQIAAQLTAAISAPAYAKLIGMSTSINRSQLIGAILHCGIYDASLIRTDEPLSSFMRSVGWAYFGRQDFLNHPRIGQFSVNHHVTKDFPPTFISAGNVDPLLSHSLAMADALAKQDVPVDRLFFPQDHAPPIGHEYQFNLDSDAGKLALERTLKFLASISRP